MTTAVAPASVARRSPLGAKLWNAVVAAWGGVTGVLPHVLHHVGPLAGAAVLAGAGGTAIFFAIGLVAAIPPLRRLHRRFGTWLAPATAVAAFAAMFTLSTVVIAPLVTGSGDEAKERPAVEAPRQSGPAQPISSGHAAHHK